MLGQYVGQCWPAVYDVGPTLTQHWLNVSCLLGRVEDYCITHYSRGYNDTVVIITQLTDS